MFGLFIFRGILRSCNLSYACCLSDAVYAVDAKQIGDFFGGLGQETEECILKLCGYIYHQGTYTPQAGNEKGAGFLPFIGVRPSQCVMVCAISMTSSTSTGLFRYR